MYSLRVVRKPRIRWQANLVILILLLGVHIQSSMAEQSLDKHTQIIHIYLDEGAYKQAIISKGVVNAPEKKVEIVGYETRFHANFSDYWQVQVGSFKDLAGALRAKAWLEEKGESAYIRYIDEYYVVRLGPFTNEAMAKYWIVADKLQIDQFLGKPLLIKPHDIPESVSLGKILCQVGGRLSGETNKVALSDVMTILLPQSWGIFMPVGKLNTMLSWQNEDCRKAVFDQLTSSSSEALYVKYEDRLLIVK